MFFIYFMSAMTQFYDIKNQILKIMCISVYFNYLFSMLECFKQCSQTVA